MTTRFIGKNIRKKIVRPMKNSVKHKNYTAVMEYKLAEEAKKEAKQKDTEDVVPQKENKKQKKGKNMVSEKKLSQMETIVGSSTDKANVQVENTANGLYCRTEESVVVMTADNKMLLND